MRTCFGMRLTKTEKSNIHRLAKSFGLSASDYIKLKVFEHNPDALKQEPKYIVPDKSKHCYIIATTQVKLLYMFQKLFEKLNFLTKDEFGVLEKELSTICRQTVERLGYLKLEKPEDE